MSCGALSRGRGLMERRAYIYTTGEGTGLVAAVAGRRRCYCRPERTAGLVTEPLGAAAVELEPGP